MKAQLPTDVDTCLQHIRDISRVLFQAERVGNSALVYDSEQILTHLRYRYIILADKTDDESLAYKLLYEVELPEMIYKPKQSITFGDFTAPISDEIFTAIEECDMGIVLDECDDFEPEVSSHQIAEEECVDELPRCNISAPSVVEHEVAVLALDDSSAAVYKQSRVEPKGRFTYGDRCVPCNGNHALPIVLGSAFVPGICKVSKRREEEYIEIDKWRCEDVKARGVSIKSDYTHIRRNHRIAPIVKLDFEPTVRHCAYLFASSGGSVYAGKDFMLYSRDFKPDKKTLQTLALSKEIRSFAMKHL